MDISLPRLLDDETRYNEAFNELAKYSKKFESFSSWTDKVYPELVIQKLRQDNESTLRVMDIGSGTGEIALGFVSKLMTKFPDVLSTIVEPNQKSLTIFKEKVTQRGLLSVEWDWQNKTWDQYYRDLKTVGNARNHFDLITSVHSIYHLGDTDTVIAQLLDCLVEGGVLILTLTAAYLTSWKFSDRFPMLPESIFSERSSSSVKQLLGKNEIQYEAKQMPLIIDIPDCFDPENEEGQLMLDFLMHVSQFRKTAPSDLVNAVLDGIGSPDFATKEDGKIIVNGTVDTIVIKKFSGNVQK
ncbi:histamine N-methyltransferase-like [Apostichopus japonicus]|uniref:histamine N-methyltransferase-like n=1 Tax=Stichopus japonicus TaxID=307972 RepID=UPI003AB4B177